jgi:hypothetical protein
MTDENTRELTVEELDVGGAAQDLMMGTGAAIMALSAGSRGKQMFDMHWRSVPFVKAVCQLARENPGRTRELWAEALRAPMPFGLDAIGMPMVAVGVGGER